MERRESYPSSQLVGLTDVLERFMAGEVGDVDAACLGLPAPIDANGVFPLTNLPWQIDRNLVVKLLGTERVALINDVEASAAGIPGISSESLICLQEGQIESGANRAIVSIGTGLGVSVLTAPGHAFATESGYERDRKVNGILSFVSRYLMDRVVDFLETAEYRVNFESYDWTLNDQAVAASTR